MSEATALVIREQTGRRRAVTLRGRASPHRNGPAWTLTQRTARTSYPGNPEATMQVLGPDLDTPTTLSGVWRDRYMVEDGQPVVEVEGFTAPTTAEALAAVMSDLLRAGATVEVTWGPFRRWGVVKQIELKPDRLEDIAWQVEFEWVADADTTLAREAVTARGSVTYVPPLEEAAACVQALEDHAPFGPLDTLASVEAAIFQAVSDVGERMSALLEGSRQAAGVLRVPAQIVQSVRASATSISYLTGQLIEEAVGSAYTTQQATDDLTSVLSLEAWRRDLAFFADQVRSVALDTARGLEHRAEPDAVRVVVMDASGSLRALAAREYGTADAWGELADANGFDSPYVPPGTSVFIPARGGA